MNPFVNQTDRLKRKLVQARQSDPKCTVFGAAHHRYEIGPPLDQPSIETFESRHDISLPTDYVAFLTRVGHGSPLKYAAAAGPFYGISPLPETNPSLGGANALKRTPIIQPDMPDQDWADQIHWFGQDHNHLSDAAFEVAHTRATERLYGGLLTIGFQGCQSHSTLVVIGPHKGRVVNIDTDGSKPRFAFEANFLDWYERWLDEVISGKLLSQQTTWFGYDHP